MRRLPAAILEEPGCGIGKLDAEAVQEREKRYDIDDERCGRQERQVNQPKEEEGQHRNDVLDRSRLDRWHPERCGFVFVCAVANTGRSCVTPRAYRTTNQSDVPPRATFCTGFPPRRRRHPRLPRERAETA